MPHTFILATPDAQRAMRELSVEGLSQDLVEKSFSEMAETMVAAAFRLVGENLERGKESRVRAIAPTSSMPVALTLMVAAWHTPERAANREEIRLAIEDFFREMHSVFADTNVFLELIEKPDENAEKIPTTAREAAQRSADRYRSLMEDD